MLSKIVPPRYYVEKNRSKSLVRLNENKPQIRDLRLSRLWLPLISIFSNKISSCPRTQKPGVINAKITFIRGICISGAIASCLLVRWDRQIGFRAE